MADDDVIAQAEALERALKERLMKLPEYRAWVMASNMVTALKSGNMDIQVLGTGAALAIPRALDNSPPRKLRLNLSRPSQGDAAEAVLKEAGRPMTTPEIVAGIRAKGAKVGGQDPLINVSSTLSRDDRFIAMRHGQSSVWTLARPTLDFGGETGADTPAAD